MQFLVPIKFIEGAEIGDLTLVSKVYSTLLYEVWYDFYY